jgi:hypothetical protein
MADLRTAAYNSFMHRDDDDQTETDKDQTASVNDDKSNKDDVDEDETGSDRTKRGEGPDNLRRRSEWFQKRSGGR